MQEAAALGLALCSLLLGLVPWEPYLSIPHGMSSNLFGPTALAKSFLIILGGAIAAILLGRWGPQPGHLMVWKALTAIDPIRRAGGLVEGLDDILRQ